MLACALRILTVVLLAASALLHLYFGAVFAIDPRPLMADLSLDATSPVGWIEMRAFYGGLMLALGALFALSALSARWRHAGLVWMTVTYAGAACVRALWIGLDGISDALLLNILAIEAGGAILGAVCWLGAGLPRLLPNGSAQPRVAKK